MKIILSLYLYTWKNYQLNMIAGKKKDTSNMQISKQNALLMAFASGTYYRMCCTKGMTNPN